MSKRRLMTYYDPKCYELACCFLADNPSTDTTNNRNALAEDIQSAIEDFLANLGNS